MDVRMPDGTIVRNVPEGTTRAQLQARMSKKAAPPPQKSILRSVDDAVRGAADILSLGYSDEIAAKLGALTGVGGNRGDYKGNVEAERQRDAQGGTDRVLGQLAGAVLLPSAGARGLGGAAMEGALFGAGYGSGSAQDGHRLAGALQGAVTGGAGGALGNAAVRGAARVLSPATSKAAKLLASEGVPLTLGQMLGGRAKAVEDKLASLPVAGGFVRNAQRKSIEGFNRAALNRALAPLGKQLPDNISTGQDANEFVQRAFDEAYERARAGMQFEVDDSFEQGIADIWRRAKAGGLTKESTARLGKLLDNTVSRRRLNNGRASGDAYKGIVSQLRKVASTTNDRELSGALHEVLGLIDETARRSSDPKAVRLMEQADTGYAQLARIEEAAKRRGGEDGMFTPAQFDAAVQKADRSARNRKYLRGDALMQDLSSAGKEVLPQTVPNSGTADRLLQAGMFAAPVAAYQFDPRAGLALAALTAPYTPAGRALTQKLLMSRPEAMRRAGDVFKRRAAIGGLVGGPFLLSQSQP